MDTNQKYIWYARTLKKQIYGSLTLEMPYIFTYLAKHPHTSRVLHSWLGLLYALILFHAAIMTTAAVEISLTPLERFIRFVTDVPPIDSAVCEMGRPFYGRSIYQFRYCPSILPYQWSPNSKLPPPSYRFRFKPASFLARTRTSLTDLDAPFSSQEKAVGVWEDDYWFLEPHSGWQSSLNTYHYIPNDWGNALAGYSEFMCIFNVFVSFGISGEGAGSVVIGKGAPLDLICDSVRYPISLRFKDGIPFEASFRRPIGPQRVFRDVTISYIYDTNIAPLGIPTQWIYDIGPTTGKLHILKLGDSHKPLPREIFMPNNLLTNKQMFHLVRSNRHDYIINKDGKMSRIDDPQLAMTVLERKYSNNRNYYLMLVVFFSLLLVPCLLALAKKQNENKKQQK